MMSLEDYKSRYGGRSESEVNSLVHSDSEFRDATEALYQAYFRMQLNKKCGDCWKDAYILLQTRKVSKDMEHERLFDLKAGALLRDVRNMNDSSRLVTRLNLTDDLALYHLGTNPDYIKFFSKYPENWRELATRHIAKLDAPAADAAEDPEAKKAAAEAAVKAAEAARDKASEKVAKAQNEDALKKASAALRKAEAKLAKAQEELAALSA